MTLRLALRRLLPLLAVLSLALTPVAAPAATAGMHVSMTASAAPLGHADHPHAIAMDHAGMTAMDMADPAGDDMPCCPKEKAAKPDCAKGCPLMALCLASLASLLPVAVPVPMPVATRGIQCWPSPSALASLHGTPLPEPPRA